MRRVCVLLNGAVSNDSRVIKTIRSISNFHYVDLFYVNGNDSDAKLFNDNVRLHNIKKDFSNFKSKIIAHSFFYNRYLFFIKAVLDTKKHFDFIYANDLPTLKPAYKIKKKLNCKLIYDSHEIYTGTLNQFFPDNASIIKNMLFKSIVGFMRFFGNFAERKYVKQTDYFITTSESFKAYFQKRFSRNDIRIVMNCPPIDNKTESFDFKQKYNLNKNDFILIFQGVLNKGRALEQMIDAFEQVNDNIKLIILGDGMLKKMLVERVNKKNLTQVIFFMNRVPSGELLYYTRGADCGINLQAPINISKKLASANKLFEYMHAGIPIIASDVPENKIVVEKYNLGYLVQNNPQEIAYTLNKISQESLDHIKDNCKKAALEYNWENQEKRLMCIFE